MKKPETKFKERVLKDLQNTPYTWVEKIQQVAKRGTPDLLICMGGKFIAIELKKDEHEAPDPLQQLKLQRIEDAGGDSFVVHPGNWDIVYTHLIETHLQGKTLEPGDPHAH
jgi:hypothetical protein